MKDEKTNTGFSESSGNLLDQFIIAFFFSLKLVKQLCMADATFFSVSLSDEAINVSYILLATVPVLLLIILVVSGVLCYRIMARK